MVASGSNLWELFADCYWFVINPAKVKKKPSSNNLAHKIVFVRRKFSIIYAAKIDPGNNLYEYGINFNCRKLVYHHNTISLHVMKKYV